MSKTREMEAEISAKLDDLATRLEATQFED